MSRLLVVPLALVCSALLTGCPGDSCEADASTFECEDDDEDGFCAECCGPYKPDGSLCQPDCDDTDPWTHPGATDAHVDGLDANCDGIDGPVAQPVQETCGNGLDDDGNGLIDCEEVACSAHCPGSAQQSCDMATPIGDGTVWLSFINTSDWLSTCGGNERVLRYDAPAPGTLDITVSRELYVSALTSCTSSASCEALAANVVTHISVPSGSTYLVVESLTTAEEFQLTATFTPYVCGDGLLTDGEGCDDGNIIVGDGCDASCQPEAFYPTCQLAPELPLGTTTVATTEGTNMVESTCGDASGELEHLYVFYPPSDGTLSVALETSGPASLFVRSLCTVQLADLDCEVADVQQPGLLHIAATAESPLFVFVDGADLAGATLTALFNAH